MNEMIDNKIPAIECTLQGGYLIEASAGTGKTWTLTGILLRLLIEKKILPERIIATTFTKNSAKEMQERLQLRLNEFYHYLIWLQSCKKTAPHWFINHHHSDNPHALRDTIKEIQQSAKEFHIAGHDDVINLHLIAHLLADEQPKILDFAILRISLLLSTLDKIFIGTLDSLTQKWLKEFSSEMSQQSDATITMNADELIYALIHDELRREHSSIQKKSPRLYEFLDKSIFENIAPVFKLVEVALQFYNAPIDDVDVIDDDKLTQIDDELDEIMKVDFGVFEPYYDLDHAKMLGFNGTSKIAKRFTHLKNIIELIQKHQSKFVFYLNEPEKNLLNDLPEIHNQDKLFKKNHDLQKQEFYRLPIDKLLDIVSVYDKILSLNENYQTYFYQTITKTIKQKLKTTLEHKKQSTFTHQMVMLNEALSNNKSLARHIRYLYPVALIDESQDINGLQAEMIGHIYLNPLKQERQKNKKTRGFLLLVGDPKQAIYRFRGGDVVNYSMIKNITADNKDIKILNQDLTLNENRRSHQGLIDALNQWFGRDDDGKAHDEFGSGIYYQHIRATNDERKISWQSIGHKNLPNYLSPKALSILYFDNDGDEDHHKAVALHINSLLQDGHTITIEGKQRPILPTDIAILSKNHDDLNKMKHHLYELGIKSIASKEINVFTTQSAKDLYYLLTIIIDGVSHQKIITLLTSPLFGLSLEQCTELLTKETDYYHALMSYFNEARHLFHKQGIISAINVCLSNNPIKEFYKLSTTTLWENIAKQGERYMADLSQIIELIGIRQYAHHRDGQFMSWFLSMTQDKDKSEQYHQLPLPSETGITLMTIHKSKGLEFPIVYVFGLDYQSKASTGVNFYPYSDKDFHRKISPTPHQDLYDEFFYKKDKQEQLEENKRLGYVALTRASEQVFVVAKALKRVEKEMHRPLWLWLNSNGIQVSLPKRLVNHVGFIEMNHATLNINPYQHHDNQKKLLVYEDWHDVFKNKQFYPQYSTSATDMMAQLDYQQSMYQKDLDDEFVPFDEMADYQKIPYKDNDIRLSFIKGKEAGIFLHEIMRYVSKDTIGDTINHVAKKLGYHQYIDEPLMALELGQIYQANHQSLSAWIDDIISAPMMASGISLNQLPSSHYAKEMGFSLGVNSSFLPKEIGQLFQKYTDKSLNITDNELMGGYKFLNGEMDLVYEYEGKFYIVDYKSNFVGQYLSDYDEYHLNQVMNEAGYWLQACIYQVALHRLLSIRIKDYQGNETNYLGAVEFIFVRGIDKSYPTLGHICWSIPIEMILSLDKLLGQH